MDEPDEICSGQDCDGAWHDCYNCGGEGYVEPDDWQDDEDEVCGTCSGEGGWPCPLLKEGAR